MSKMTAPDLKELFKQASEIAQQVPKNLQEAAFNRAVDLLARLPKSDYVPTPQKKNETNRNNLALDTEATNSSIADLLSKIDSTQYPGILSASKVLDRSLLVLMIALKDHHIDGLTPSAIARILTDKFRMKTTKEAIGMALGRATTLVNRTPDGQGFLYKIMAPGEEYLSRLDSGDNLSRAVTSTRKVRTKKTAIKSNNDISTNNGGKQNRDRKTKKKNVPDQRVAKKSIVGPKGAILSLIESGFFDKGKTGPEVQTYLKNKRGFNIGAAQLRLAMLRLVRDKKLDRDEGSSPFLVENEHKPQAAA